MASSGAANRPNMTPAQLRIARAGLGWSVPMMAAAAQVSARTVQRYEKHGRGSPETVLALEEALEKAGVRFVTFNGFDGVDVPSAAPD